MPARVQMVVGAPVRATPSAAGDVHWRLLGANNRELAWSAVSFVDVEAAHRSLARTRGALDRAAVTVVADGPRLWVWRVAVDGDPHMVSARAYQRRAECGRSAALCLADLARATVADAVLDLRRDRLLDAGARQRRRTSTAR